MECIAYKGGYKYQLKHQYSTDTGIQQDQDVTRDYISLSADGRITIKEGYAWDGPSGPIFDTLNLMRGSLVHDALYQLMRGPLDEDRHREPADRLLQSMCREDGTSALGAWWVYQGVRLWGGPATDPDNERPVIRAPKACQDDGD